MGLRQIAEETVAALERGNYIGPGGSTVEFTALLKNCLEGTHGYKPDALNVIRDQVLSSPSEGQSTAFELANETTLQGAARLVATGQYQRVGVLNFASAKHPGGGFLGGAKAQEESLARSSGLYLSLMRCPNYYSFNRHLNTSLYSDWMIFSPDCPVLRNDAGDWLEAPYVVSFLTSPAPNAGAIAKNEPRKVEMIQPTLQERAGKVLALAAYHQCDALILGAWGCGVFKNDPNMVASIFWDYLRPGGLFSGRFKKVLFSVLDTFPGQRIYGAFAKYFGERR